MTNDGLWKDMKEIANLKKTIVKLRNKKEVKQEVKSEKVLNKITPLHDFSWYL